MSPLRVMIVDDHRLMRDGLRLALEVEEDIEVVGEAGEGREAVGRARELQPDLVLMDIMMPGMSGIDACLEIRNLLPETRVVMLTASGDEESVTASLVAGAQGYVLKAAGRDDLLRSIRAVGRGESIPDPSVTRIVLPSTDNGLIGSSKRTRIEALIPILTKPSGGVTETTLGLTLSTASPVMKTLPIGKLSAAPSRSRIPLVILKK